MSCIYAAWANLKVLERDEQATHSAASPQLLVFRQHLEKWVVLYGRERICKIWIFLNF